ncbi:S9 family peptidase [Proteobacteria bacterium 005FR1]|nr:S9 family peptidase [Proteobacteria bacterium 005FR1]
MSKQPAAYGSWPSPITAELLTAANVGLSEPLLDGDTIYWLESRPLERGRTTVVRMDADGHKRDLLPEPLNARSRVNEYGGGSYCVQDGILYFVLYDDQRIYALDTGAEKPVPKAITAEGPWRFGDLRPDPKHKRLLAICEDHRQPDAEEKTFVAAIPLGSDDEQTPLTLVEGKDFYAGATVSPDGQRIAWLSWNHPNMPWDGCECWVGEFDGNGNISEQRRVAGGQNESICQPQWSPDGELYLVSDRSDWWNIYRVEGEGLTAVCAEEAEYASPQWVFGQSSYAFVDPATVIACFTREGRWNLCLIDLASGKKRDLITPLNDLAYLRADSHMAVFIGASGDSYPALYRFERDTDDALTTVVKSGSITAEAGYLSQGEAIEFPLSRSLGEEGQDGKGYAFFYSPCNQAFCGEPDTRPPLLVLCHGGPTSATRGSLNLKIQYWTSRGFAVADVNYGGSTGFGRRYRERLKGQWGVVDVQDAIDCVSYLADAGLVDGYRVAIRGSSAGGYTVLAALTFDDTFRTGASLYGVGDLEALAKDTHKFESRYMDNLIGPYPEKKSLYQERSPLNHIERLNRPVIFLQGLKDKIVPPNQAEAMVAALDKKEIPVAYVTFEEEAHGFRQAPNIRRALEAELHFYSQVFGFDLIEPVEPVTIRHADKLRARR